MNQIAFNQQLSDKLNEVLNPTLYSTPGKGEITVVANEKNDLREYRIITENYLQLNAKNSLKSSLAKYCPTNLATAKIEIQWE